MTQEQKIKEIAKKIEAKYQMSGLSEGIYFDFARDVSIEYGEWVKQKILEILKAKKYKSVKDKYGYDPINSPIFTKERNINEFIDSLIDIIANNK